MWSNIYLKYLISIIHAGPFKSVDKSLILSLQGMIKVKSNDGVLRSMLDPKIHNSIVTTYV